MGLRRPRPLRAVRRLSAVLLGSPAGPPSASSSSSEKRRRVPLPGHFPGWPWPTAWAGVAGPPAPWGQVGGTPAATLWALPPWRSRPGGARGRQPGQPPVPRPSFVAFAAGRRAAPGGTRPAPPPRCPAARSGAERGAVPPPALQGARLLGGKVFSRSRPLLLQGNFLLMNLWIQQLNLPLLSILGTAPLFP